MAINTQNPVRIHERVKSVLSALPSSGILSFLTQILDEILREVPQEKIGRSERQAFVT